MSAPERVGVKKTTGYEHNSWEVVTHEFDEEAEVYVREDLLAAAILGERERWETEVQYLKAFRAFTIINTDVRDCPICSGPRLGNYVCTHCGDDE